MMVDSNYERETLRYITELQTEYKSKINFVIRKPLFDVGRRHIDDAMTDDATHLELDEDGAPKILIPDFVLEFPQFDENTGDIIVETMGFPWKSYRDDKAVTIPAMEAELGVKAITHDFHEPTGETQVGRNEAFKETLRQAIDYRVEFLRSLREQ